MLKRLALVSIMIASAGASADTVVLKTGQVIEGKVVSNDDKGVVVEVTFGTMLITQDKILRIEEESAEGLAAHEKDAAAKREYAAKMKADGKVLYKGKWVSEKEKEADEEKVAAAKKKKDSDIAAKKAAQVAEDKKRQEAADKLAAQQATAQRTADNGPSGRTGRDRNRNDRTDAGNRPNHGSTVDVNNELLDRLRNSGINPDTIKNYVNGNH
jgi:hypothetical protein